MTDDEVILSLPDLEAFIDWNLADKSAAEILAMRARCAKVMADFEARVAVFPGTVPGNTVGSIG